MQGQTGKGKGWLSGERTQHCRQRLAGRCSHVERRARAVPPPRGRGMSEAPRGPYVRIFDFRTKTISTTVLIFLRLQDGRRGEGIPGGDGRQVRGVLIVPPGDLPLRGSLRHSGGHKGDSGQAQGGLKRVVKLLANYCHFPNACPNTINFKHAQIT